MKLWQSFVLGVLVGLILSGAGYLLIQRSKMQPIAFISLTATQQEKIIVTPGTDRLNLNTASIKELDALPGIGEEKAKSILEFRTKYGPFRSIEDLLYVPGIGKSLFEQIRNKIFVQ
jgi:competence protein ComEA